MKQGNEHRERNTDAERGEFSQAVNRFEKAVQDLVTVTTGELSSRATSVIEETTKRLEMELKVKRASGGDQEAAEEYERRYHRHQARHNFSDSYEPGQGQLYIDPEDKKIAGVSAAFARYFGVESWIMRIGALTGLIFIPTIVFPGYWIAYFLIKKRGHGSTKKRSVKQRRRRGGKSTEAHMSEDQEPAPTNARERVQRARRNLRHLNDDLTQAELRLRRLESFVTSDQYELQRELNRIEQEGKPA